MIASRQETLELHCDHAACVAHRKGQLKSGYIRTSGASRGECITGARTKGWVVDLVGGKAWCPTHLGERS